MSEEQKPEWIGTCPHCQREEELFILEVDGEPERRLCRVSAEYAAEIARREGRMWTTRRQQAALEANEQERNWLKEQARKNGLPPGAGYMTKAEAEQAKQNQPGDSRSVRRAEARA